MQLYHDRLNILAHMCYINQTQLEDLDHLNMKCLLWLQGVKQADDQLTKLQML